MYFIIDHGKVLLDPEYPQKAPVICLLTPNGRWDINKPICLSGRLLYIYKYIYVC